MIRAPELALWLALWATLAMFAALPVRAQEGVIHCGSDTVEVTREGAGVALTYSNSISQRSASCDVMVVEVEGHIIEFSIAINAGPDFAERFTVVPPIGWGAVPEQIDVEDGGTGKVYVMPWLF